MKLALIAATKSEVDPFCHHFSITPNASFKLVEEHEIMVIVSGPGIPNTLMAMLTHPLLGEADLLINVGVCGSFERHISLGTIVEIYKDRFGDLGAETADGNFIDIFEMGLEDKNITPFRDGWIHSSHQIQRMDLPRKSGITVQKVHGNPTSINRISEKYCPETESMEGAAFFLVAHKLEKPSLQIRSLSNYVEPRNRDNWQMETAISMLNTYLIENLIYLR